MSRAIVLEVAQHGINTLATGSRIEKEAVASRYTPMGHPHSATEMACMVAFLASPGVGYITAK